MVPSSAETLVFVDVLLEPNQGKEPDQPVCRQISPRGAESPLLSPPFPVQMVCRNVLTVSGVVVSQPVWSLETF